MATTQELRFSVGETPSVSAVLACPPHPRFLYVLAHGAGAGMRHPFLERMSAALAERSVATFRYQFPYMENKQRRPDSPAAVRAAVHEAARTVPDLPLVAGGKSFGGRMTSTAQSQEPLPGVVGLAFLGFPLHPPGRPGVVRAQHLDDVKIPMLFLQGDRDDFAELILLRQVVRKLGTRATLHVVKGGDHSFGVRKTSGRTADEVLAELAGAMGDWAVELTR